MSSLDFVGQMVAVDGDMKALDEFTALANEFQRASNEIRKRACLVACRLAVTRAAMEPTIFGEALQLLEASKPVLPKLRKSVARLAKELDLKYLELNDTDESGAAAEKACLNAFFVAHAAAAISSAVSAFCKQSSEAMDQSIYEAVQSSGQDREFIASVRKALSKPP